MDDSDLFDAFLRLHSGLPREAPGSDAAARRALQIAAPPPRARIAEMGCGPGASVVSLLQALPGAHVTGLDLHGGFLRDAARRAGEIGEGHRFTGMIGDMAAPPMTGPFEMIWSEGAAYAVGVTEALRAWAPLLVPGGVVALSDAVWLTAEPHEAARAVFADYPGMSDMAGLRDKVTAAGFQPLGAFELGAQEWDNYYLPLAARCDAMEAELGATPAGREVLRLTRAEIAARGTAGRDYAYAFIVARKAPD